jgi:hypothetical protein
MANPYVINLDEATDRWTHIQNVWKNSFNLTRVPAIKHSPGWVGCALSHIKIIEEAKQRNDPYVLIWEDDCIPMNRNGIITNPTIIKRLWDSILENLSKHTEKWDIILGGSSKIFPNSFSLDTNLTTSFVKVFRIMNGFTTHWTLYNRSVYDKIIEWKIIKDCPIDVYMYKHARVFVTLHFFGEQKEGFSNIENRQTDYHSMFENAEKDLKRRGFSILNILPQV